MDLLPNDILIEILVVTDIPSLINLLCVNRTIYQLYCARFEYFWTQRYHATFKSVVPDELALSYWNKYKLHMYINNPKLVHNFNSVSNNYDYCGPIASFHVSDKMKALHMLADLYNQKDPLIYPHITNITTTEVNSENISLLLDENKYEYELRGIPLYQASGEPNAVDISFGYLDGCDDYYSTIANFSGFTTEQVFSLLAFIYNLGPKEENDIAHFVEGFTSDMLAGYKKNVEIATAKDVQEAFYSSSSTRPRGAVKFHLKSIPVVTM